MEKNSSDLPQSAFNTISVCLELCQQSRGGTSSCVAHLTSPQPPPSPFIALINCHSQLHRNENDFTSLVDVVSGARPCLLFVSLLFHFNLPFPSLSVQLSGLGGLAQSSPSSGWKPGPLDSAGRQRSSSDPPNMHPPLPPMRLTSTGGMAPALRAHRFSFALQTNELKQKDRCVPALGLPPAVKIESMSKSGQGPSGTRAVPPKSPPG